MAATRTLRADAQRNRDRLLEVAVRVLSQAGPDVPLEAIAKEAGVGIGTLYRHFPSREALVDAALPQRARPAGRRRRRTSCATCRRSRPARLDGPVRRLPRRQARMGDATAGAHRLRWHPFAHSRDRLTTSVGTLLRAGAAARTLRADVAPDDVLVSLSALSLASADRGDREQAGRLLDLLMDALRVHA